MKAPPHLQPLDQLFCFAAGGLTLAAGIWSRSFSRSMAARSLDGFGADLGGAAVVTVFVLAL